MEPQPERPLSTISLSSYVRLLQQNPNFRRLWAAQIISEIGDWFYSLAIYHLLLELTGRAGAVALALVLQVLPQTFIGPASGVVNDRICRKLVMISADLARFVIVLSMLAVRSPSMAWLVYPLLFLETIMAAFFEPARSSVIPNIVPRESALLANTLSSATWSVNLLIGAALGGLVTAFLGRDATFGLNALSFLGSAALIAGMRFDEPHAEAAAPLRVGDLLNFSPVLEGLRYVRGDRRLLATVFAKAGELMIGPSWVLFTVMGQRYFPVRWHGIDAQKGGILGMTLLMGARGVGALIGPLLSARWAGHSQQRMRRAVLFGYCATALGYTILGLSGSVWLACLAVVFGHAGGSTVWVSSTTILQLNTDDRFRGRVFAADLGFAMLTIALGAYLCGLCLDRGISARTVATTTGFAMLVPAALWGLALRGWDQNSRPPC
jgi:MFS family permease